MPHFLTAALYKFVALPDFRQMQAPLLARCQEAEVKGTLLLAEEGINGTIAGSVDGIEAVLDYLRSDPRLADLEHKRSYSEAPPFQRMKVRLKREIVTLGVPGVSPTQMAGEYVKPHEWNRLIEDPEVVVVDCRNDYEVAIGSFAGAVNPHTRSFSELPAWVDRESAPGGLLAGKPRVAMFCTGGIRCEKSTALMRMKGFDEVYHLEGGILKYLETVPEAASSWQGECFVFDERVSVGHALVPGDYALCLACGHPVSADERANALFEHGVSCPHCHPDTSEARRAELRQRRRQQALAAAHGAGADA
ncbi:MAG: rhodanese-related sulfurtransferase [Rhodocyclaceae bacterium]|nr:rhodanese-related sulfurtransferase [Rhodocyclaceae bacterium]MCP5241770.1 rhodanese-related sulfurtransferase [Zoogloeaceae bacterium]MCP5256178.1 rhodanese-related sulfurtransferase [Zoogloeaceae bacterium]MCP5295860.1 rhodanese-related sulfurtransferase [Zoogloeaceae bacterium]MCW5616820.1 rhodanese-related sulfurtransferase [Rhodocyclaceae bacterium]